MSARTRNFVFIVGILTVASILYMTGFTTRIGFQGIDGGMRLSGPNQSGITIYFDDITSMSYSSEPDYGEAIDGGVKSNCMYGTWKNDEYGTYLAYTSTRIPGCVWITTKDAVIAFNYESKDTTEAFYDAYSKYWEELQAQISNN